MATEQEQHPKNPTAPIDEPSIVMPDDSDDLSQQKGSSAIPNEVPQSGPYQGRSILVGRGVSHDYPLKNGAAMIKSLTGGDRLETEQKCGGKFGMRGTFFVIITANSRLPIAINGDASAWRRRLVFEEPGDQSVNAKATQPAEA